MKIAASAAIIKDKKILLIKRSNYSLYFPGHWTLPGGKAEEGEPVNKTIVREIKEEVNLDFKPGENYHISIFKDRRVFHYLGE